MVEVTLDLTQQHSRAKVLQRPIADNGEALRQAKAAAKQFKVFVR